MTAPDLSQVEIPNTAATSEEFEFAALSHARNYRRKLMKEFSTVCSGDLLEIGVGIGQIVEELLTFPAIRSISALEPDERFASRFREKFPDIPLFACTTDKLGPDVEFDTIVCVNVLEHIRDDLDELMRMRRLLEKRKGHLALLVPARAEIYSHIDNDFGHWRRYNLRDLKKKLSTAGFVTKRIRYYNFAGYFAWALNFRVLRRRHFDIASVRTFDALIFPWVNWIERRIVSPCIGQSLLVIAQAGRQG